MVMGLTWVLMMIEGLLMYSRDLFEELEVESKVRRAEVCIAKAFGFVLRVKW